MYRIVLENSQGCELDGRIAATEEDIKGATLALVEDVELAPGDVIRIVEQTG